MQGNIIAICLEQLVDQFQLLRQWLALCLAKVCLQSVSSYHFCYHQCKRELRLGNVVNLQKVGET